jgi:hypothetical protein
VIESLESRAAATALRADPLHEQPPPPDHLPRIEVAPGELLDKLTILDLKNERITEPAKLANVRRELASLRAVAEESCPPSAELIRLTEQLRAVNAALWDIEDQIRYCEKTADFGDRFVQLARSIYRNNDRRAALKRSINLLLGSKFIEEKAYCSYEQSSEAGL